ncbi:MAG: hypothetical protein RR239_02090 [Oscillospiraceae bacterium]
MEKIINTFELFCIKENKNTTINEIVSKDGKRSVKCSLSHTCSPKCECITRLNSIK